MGRIRTIVSKVKDGAAPVAAVLREEVVQRVEKVKGKVMSQDGGSKVNDEWSFKSQTAGASDGEKPAAGGQSAESPENQQVRITAQPSMTDPWVCKFVAEVPVFEERLIRVRNREMAEHSPLARHIFEIPQVSMVSFSGNTVTVSKNSPEPWQVVAKQIGPAIRAFLASGEPAITEDFQDTPLDPKSDEALFERVQEVIETMINPGVAAHGGFVVLQSVEDGVAYVQMGGGCHGCGMADVTLKQGVVTTIQAQIPEIKDVLDATDHSSGMNPFYMPGH